mmetsp:Transcript_141222/g.316652  ORF Transcript_141222/g.316652 Transcript_141222/m.316652 type:complete len:178 (+) Transcript_141222:45-578(+)
MGLRFDPAAVEQPRGTTPRAGADKGWSGGTLKVRWARQDAEGASWSRGRRPLQTTMLAQKQFAAPTKSGGLKKEQRGSLVPSVDAAEDLASTQVHHRHCDQAGQKRHPTAYCKCGFPHASLHQPKPPTPSLSLQTQRARPVVDHCHSKAIAVRRSPAGSVLKTSVVPKGVNHPITFF